MQLSSITKQKPNYSGAFRHISSLILIVAEVVLASIAVFPYHYNLNNKVTRPSASVSLVSQHPDFANVGDPLSDALPQPRRLLPYSVIPGGIESVAELKSAIQSDPVVARHYADFNLERARVVTLDRDRAVYVSYRMGSEIFWTNRRLYLRRGETVVSDGVNAARTRCGNRISENLLSPTSAKQPPLEALERFPVVGPLEAANFPIDGSLAPFNRSGIPSSFGLPTGLGPSSGLLGAPSAPFAAGPGPGTISASNQGSTSGSPSGFGSTPGAGTGTLGTSTDTGSSGSSSPSGPGGPGSPSGPGGPTTTDTPTGGTPLIGTPEPSAFLFLSVALVVLAIGEKFNRKHRRAG
jgi:hypothetical protein